MSRTTTSSVLSRLTSGVLRTQLSGAARRPGRLIMTGLSVLVAAFVVFGTVMTYQIMTRTTLDTFSDTPAATSLVVEPTQGGMVTAAQLAAVRATPGVAEAIGRIDTSMVMGGMLSDNFLSVAADPGTGPLSRLTVVSGRYPARAGEIALHRRAADWLALAPGATVMLRTGDAAAKPVQVTVTALVDSPSDSEREQAYAPDTLVAALCGGPAAFPRVDIRAAAGQSAPELSDRLSELMASTPDAAFSVIPGDTIRTREARDAVAQFNQIFALVGMFIAIAVVAAALVVTSTFRVVFAQRLRQLALLRAIGAHRGQLVRALAVEGLAVGLLTGAIGVALAFAAGHAVPVVARAMGRTVSSPGVPTGAAVAVVLGAGLITLGAVLAPAFSAAGVPPLQALRKAGTVGGDRRIGAARLTVGVLLAAAAAGIAGLVVAGLPEPDQFEYDPMFGLLEIVFSGTLAFCALIALGPLLVRPVLALAGWPLRRLGPTGRLAVSGIGGAPRRAAAVSVVVALGVTLVTGTVIGSATLRGYIAQELAVRVPADLALFAGEATLPADVPQRLADDPHLTDVTALRIVEISLGDSDGVVTDLDLDALPDVQALKPATGTLDDLAPGSVVLARWAAEELDVRVGDRTELRSVSGKVTATVAAILPDSAPLDTAAVVTPRDLDALGATAAPNGMLANATGGGEQGLKDGRAAMRAAIGISSGADVVVLADERNEVDGQVDQLAFAALGLLGLTVLIAVVGVGTTTGLSVLERTQESGLLRALGLSRRALRRMISTESGLYGVIGAILGILLGIPYAWLAMGVLNLNANLVLPAGNLLLILVALAAITAFAGLLPARRAARVSPIAALGTPD